MSEDSLFGIDTTMTSNWRGYDVRPPTGAARNRACAQDWARDVRRGLAHPKDGYMSALIRLMVERLDR